MKNNRNKVVVKIVDKSNRIVVEVVVQGKQTKCSGGGGWKTIEMC